MIQLSKCDLKSSTLEKVYNLYKIDNFLKEGKTWHNYWYISKNSTQINDEYNISYYLKSYKFFPSIKNVSSFI